MPKHHHRDRASPLEAQHPDRGVPPHVYGRLVGVVTGPLSDVSDNHVFIPLRVRQGPAKGMHRLAFNVESHAAPHAAQYCVLDEPVGETELPEDGFTEEVSLSYRDFGIGPEQFRTVENGFLRAVVHASLARAHLVAAYGFTFPGGGIHDLHYNYGEPAGSTHINQPGKDGALAVYFRSAEGGYVRRWILIKFQSQTL